MTDSPPNHPLLLVVAAALINGNGQILLAQRPLGKPMAGLWEFPGGKVAPQETPEQALVRELEEELSIHVLPEHVTPLTFASHSYPAFHLLMPLYVCHIWQGTPQPSEGQNLVWVNKEQRRDYPMPPADVPLIDALEAYLSTNSR